MDVEKSPPWSGKMLRRLGESIIDPTAPAERHPTYEDVMAWHSDLSDAVSSRIATHQWASLHAGFDVSSRAKTIDTLREKLIRESNLKLNQVQDLAGVRVDIDGDLDDQTSFCQELASLFGGEPRATVRDIRQHPHSGYRAVHVWLRLPAGRVEVQVRTRQQSAWANAYERLGDLLGRQIRYGGYADGSAQRVVEGMQKLADGLKTTEEQHAEALKMQARVEVLERAIDSMLLDEETAGDERVQQFQQEATRRRRAMNALRSATEESLSMFLTGMDDLGRILDEVEQEEAGE